MSPKFCCPSLKKTRPTTPQNVGFVKEEVLPSKNCHQLTNRTQKFLRASIFWQLQDPCIDCCSILGTAPFVPSSTPPETRTPSSWQLPFSIHHSYPLFLLPSSQPKTRQQNRSIFLPNAISPGLSIAFPTLDSSHAFTFLPDSDISNKKKSPFHFPSLYTLPAHSPKLILWTTSPIARNREPLSTSLIRSMESTA